MKPTAWYDPSNGHVSTDRDCPLFTPLGQVWALHPRREWVDLTDAQIHNADGYTETREAYRLARAIEQALKEQNA
jgi:hypothetical protein